MYVALSMRARGRLTLKSKETVDYKYTYMLVTLHKVTEI